MDKQPQLRETARRLFLSLSEEQQVKAYHFLLIMLQEIEETGEIEDHA